MLEELEPRQLLSIQTPHDTIPNFGANPSIVSVASGNWSSPSTWSLGRAPIAGDVVSVATSTIVSYDVQSDARLQTIVVQAGAQLNFRTDLSTRVTVANFMVLEGGQLQVGTAANPVAAGVTAEIVFANQALNAANDPNQYGNGLIALGKVTMHGAMQSDTFVRLAAEPLAGQTTLTLATPVTGWRPGDRLGLPDSRHLLGHERFSNFDPEWERSTIQSISPDGRVLTLTSPLAFDHRGARNGAGALEFLPHVGNLSRNVTIKSESSSGVRGHTFFTHRADVDIRYVAFAGLGRTTDAALNNANRDERFPVNFHHLIGPQTPQANGHQYTFVGNSIFCGMSTHNFKWGIAVNGSHDGLIKDNVLYNWKGAGIVTVDGSESDNVFEHNLVMAIYGTTNPRDNDGRDASGFWFAGYNNYVRDNVVAGAGNTFQEIVSGVGYKFFISPPEGLTDLTPILEFARNEAYGAMATGLTIWHLGTDGYELTSIGQSTIRDFRVWHAWEEGFFAYPIQNVVFDGFVVRGDPRALNQYDGGIGWTSGDYWAGNVTLRRADIQGMYTGFAGSSNTPGVIRIEDSYFRNYSSNISIQTLSTPGSGASKPARQTQIINTRFDQWPGAPGFTAIQMNYDASIWNTDIVQTDQVLVYDYNGVASDDFQVFYSEQRANFIVPQTGAGIKGSPEAGLTNQQNWDRHGIAIAGAVAPGNAVTRAGIVGLVRSSSGPAVNSVGPVVPDPRNSAVSSINVTFSQPITASSFDRNDVSLARNGGSNLINSGVTIAPISATSYQINGLSSLTGSAGNYVLTVNAGGVQSQAGVAGVGSQSDNWTVDLTAPAVTINQASGQADPTGNSPISFTVTFSEPVTGFTASDLVLSGTAAGSRSGVVSGSGTTYNVAVSGMTGSGTVTASVNAGATTDAAGNSSQASTSSDNTVTYQVASTGPTVTINQAAGQVDPARNSPVSFTVIFSAAVTGFDASDLLLGGTATGTRTATVSGSGTNYNVAVSGMTGSGTVTASVRSGAAVDSGGNANSASTSSDNSVLYDNAPPAVTINQTASQADPTSASPINFTVVFSEAVTGFTASDLVFGGTASGSRSALISGSGTTYNVAVSGMTGNGTVTASLMAGAASDSAGNSSQASTSSDNSVTFTVSTSGGLIAAYGFNEGTGRVLTDLSGNGLHGTISGATWNTSGKYGRALNFDGVNDWVTINDSNALDLTSGMTLEAWIRPTTIDGWETVVFKERSGGVAYALYGGGWADEPASYITRGGSETYIGGHGSARLPLKSWSHVAATYDGTTIRLYVNGTLAGSQDAAGSIVASANVLRIGGNSVWGEWFGGRIDELRIYNRVLSAAEIQSDMKTPVGNPLHLLGDEAEGSAANLAREDLDALFDEAVARWHDMLPSSLVEDRLRNVTVDVMDLPGTKLGMGSSTMIWIDVNAAGHGWFVDLTPADDSEFDPALAGGAQGRVDLLTVLVHELGHVLGLEDDFHADPDFGSVMAWALPAGVRRIRLEATQGVAGLATNEIAALPPTEEIPDAAWALLGSENDDVLPLSLPTAPTPASVGERVIDRTFAMSDESLSFWDDVLQSMSARRRRSPRVGLILGGLDAG